MDLLTRRQAAERSGLSLATIDRMLADGRLTPYRAAAPAHTVRIDAAELDRATKPGPSPRTTDDR